MTHILTISIFNQLFSMRTDISLLSSRFLREICVHKQCQVNKCNHFIPLWGLVANPFVEPPLMVCWDLCETTGCLLLRLEAVLRSLGDDSSLLASLGLSHGSPRSRRLSEVGAANVLVKWLSTNGVLKELNSFTDIKKQTPKGRL